MAVDKISFLVQLRGKYFSVLVFGVCISQKKQWKMPYFRQKVIILTKKTQGIQTKKIHIYVGFQYFFEFQKNNGSIHRHVYNHHVTTFFQLQLRICFLYDTLGLF